MINPIKIKKNRNGDLNEDRLTSSIFRLLVHLPEIELIGILKDSLTDNTIFDENTGNLVKIESWVNWKMKKEDNMGERVEPDVFFSFENLDLIIEAKLRDEGQQDNWQWKREIKGYRNEYQENKKLALLALGGLRNYGNEKVEECEIVKTTWTRMVNVIKRRELAQADDICGTIVIYRDLLAVFRKFNYYPIAWFNEGNIHDVNIKPGSIKMLSENKFKGNN